MAIKLHRIYRVPRDGEGCLVARDLWDREIICLRMTGTPGYKWEPGRADAADRKILEEEVARREADGSLVPRPNPRFS